MIQLNTTHDKFDMVKEVLCSLTCNRPGADIAELGRDLGLKPGKMNEVLDLLGRRKDTRNLLSLENRLRIKISRWEYTRAMCADYWDIVNG